LDVREVFRDISRLCSAGFWRMHKVWEIHVGDRIKESTRRATLKDHPILAIAFSPDGKQLAVAADDHRTRTTIGTHILVMDVAAPQATLRQYEVDSCGAPLEWAPQGEAILACGSLLKLPGGETCSTYSTWPNDITPPLPSFKNSIP